MAQPVVRVSRGRFSSEKYEHVRELIQHSSVVLVPALRELPGLLYYHASVDPETNTVLNVSLWADMAAAKQLDTLKEMLAQRPILENAGVVFDKIANYEPLWKIEPAARA